MLDNLGSYLGRVVSVKRAPRCLLADLLIEWNLACLLLLIQRFDWYWFLCSSPSLENGVP